MAKTQQHGFPGMVLAFVLALVWSMPAWSADEPPVDELPPPERVVESVFEQAVDALLENQDEIRKDPRVAFELIDEILSPHVHYDLMTQLVLGRHARDASEEQLQRFARAFRDSTMRTYASMLSDNVDTVVRIVEASGEIIEIQQVSEPDARQRVNVRTSLKLEDTPLPVIYRMIATDEGWRVYDVVIENISFVTSARDDYGSEVRRRGLDETIQRLEQRNKRAWQN